MRSRRHGSASWDRRVGEGPSAHQAVAMFDTIVCATDGTAQGDRALRVARQLAEASSSFLWIVHVALTLPGGWNTHADEEQTIARLKAATASLRRRGINASLHVVRAHRGDVAQIIADTADAVDAEVIIVGTRGRSPSVGAALGATTTGLLHVAGQPVLAVPPPRRHRAGPEISRRRQRSANLTPLHRPRRLLWDSAGVPPTRQRTGGRAARGRPESPDCPPRVNRATPRLTWARPDADPSAGPRFWVAPSRQGPA